MIAWAFLSLHLRWLVAGGICAIGLVALGPADLLRFSLVRTSALAGVCFRQSLRRRVLWLTPLAMLGLIIVAQFQRPLDAFDAVRESVKYCLFASGLLAVLTTVILVCTNLPAEIDSRVIYTIVTKPATRLEIIAGKIVGFAMVSAAILFIMGLFTFGYMEFRAYRLQAQIPPQLLATGVGDAQKQALRHYLAQGLLHADRYEQPGQVQVFAKMPQPQDTIRWFYGERDQEILLPYEISQALLPAPSESSEQVNSAAQPSMEGWVIEVRVPHHRISKRQDYWSPLAPHPPTATPPIPSWFSLERTVEPAIVVTILDADQFDLIASSDIDRLDLVGGKVTGQVRGGASLLPADNADDPYVRFWVGPQVLDIIRQQRDDPRDIYVMIYATAPGWLYGADPTSINLYQVWAADIGNRNKWQPIPHLLDAQGRPDWEIFRGRYSMLGNQLSGSDDPARAPVAILPFAIDARSMDLSGGGLPFEMRAYVQRTAGEAANDLQDQTRVEISARNAQTGQTSAPQTHYVESNRPLFFTIPSAYVAGGKFELLVRCANSGHILYFRSGVLQAVVEQNSFAFNLLKSLFILWLLTILVIVVSLFSSTFVSWPIAIVLSLVILLGQWGMQQIGDTNTLSMGRTIVSQMFPDANPAVAQTFTSSVQGLSGIVSKVARFLPDISQFAAADAINRGVDIPLGVIFASLKELLLFGLPLAVVGYVILKRKEVAP